MYPKMNIVEAFEAIYDKAGIPFERTKDDVLTLTYKGEQIVNELSQRRWSVEFKLYIEVPQNRDIHEQFNKVRMAIYDSKIHTAIIYDGEGFYSDYAALPSIGRTDFPVDWITRILDSLIVLKQKGLKVLSTL